MSFTNTPDLVFVLRSLSLNDGFFDAETREFILQAAGRLELCHNALSRIRETNVFVGAIAHDLMDQALGPKKAPEVKPFHNPANADDYEHMHDYFDRNKKSD